MVVGLTPKLRNRICGCHRSCEQRSFTAMHRSCGELSEDVTASTNEVVEVFDVLTHHCSCGQRIPPLFAALHGTSPRLRDAEGAVQSECLFDAWGLHIIHLKTESRSSSGAVVHWMGSGSVVISHRYYLGARNNSTFSTVSSGSSGSARPKQLCMDGQDASVKADN